MNETEKIITSGQTTAEILEQLELVMARRRLKQELRYVEQLERIRREILKLASGNY